METLLRAARVEIKLSALTQNFEAIRRIAGGSALVAAVKADAYGHDALRVCETLEAAGADYFGVATLEEAAVLRNGGIRTPIALFSATPRGGEAELLRLGVIPAVSSFEDARRISAAAAVSPRKSPVDIILALDTGMGRTGFLPNDDSATAITRIAQLPGLRIAALASHFSVADEYGEDYTREQIAAFDGFYARLADLGVAPAIRSAANSAALVRFPEARYEAVRPGIILYGIYPSDEVDRQLLSVAPVMSVKAHIVCLRKVPAGSSISYGRRFTTERESIIATLPLGYADGLPRALTGSGRVIIRGHYAPIIGTICMDQCVIDVTDVPGVQEYDTATILGEAEGLAITAEEIAEKTQTITYEILCRFGQRLPKITV